MNEPHLRVAITTDSLLHVDANFAAAKQIVFYDVGRKSSEFVDVVPFRRRGKKGPGGGPKADGRCAMEDMEDDDGTGFDPLVERVEALKGCSILFTLGLSDLAAVRIQRIEVFPVKSYHPRPIDEVVENLQRLLNGMPPLWMRRVLRDGKGNRLPLDAQDV
jgi:nitrogen fixation protein NifX